MTFVDADKTQSEARLVIEQFLQTVAFLGRQSPAEANMRYGVDIPSVQALAAMSPTEIRDRASSGRIGLSITLTPSKALA